jgi:hypothetical protein
MKPFLLTTVLTAAVAAMGLVGCTWETDLPANAAAIRVERGRELLVTDDAVLASLSSNASDGPLGFRHVMARLPLRESVEVSVLAWMVGWSQRLRDEGETARADAFDQKLLCEGCPIKKLRLQEAPIRLVAVANRTDLSVLPDRAADGGEGRLVFALTDGPADDPAVAALPFTVIVEYAQRGTASEWASRWHALGSASTEAFPEQLSGVAGVFVEPGTLAQIRSADAVTGPLVLHEFHLEDGAIVATNVRNTPSWSAVSEGDVRAFVAANGDALANGTHVVPASWLASSSELHAVTPPYLANVQGHDALVKGTCGGCHDAADRGFQIDPLAKGEAKLSRFLLDPTKELDEMGRRTEWMQVTLSR